MRRYEQKGKLQHREGLNIMVTLPVVNNRQVLLRQIFGISVNIKAAYPHYVSSNDA